MLLSIVVPTYNEEENVPVFYEEVSAVLNQLPYEWEMIFVNDGSRDRSADKVKELHVRDPRVRLLSLSRNFGSYSAISAGLLYAHGDAMVCISCDLQDPPELIFEFVKHWEEGADIVWGVRASRDDPGLKSVYANLFYWIIRKTVWQDFPSGGMDCGLFDRRIVDLYNQLPIRNTIPFFTIYDMGFKQARIPYHRRARLRGTGNWPLFKRIKSAIDVLVDFSYVPIRIISLFGYLISALSFLYALFVVFNRVVLGVGSSGWPSIMVLVAFLGGLQLVVLGVLGEYLWRVAEQARERPRFFLMERVGFSSEENPGRNQEQYRPHSREKSSGKEAAH